MPRKGSFGEISAISAILDRDSRGGDRAGYIIVKTFRQIRAELDAQGKTTASISQNGVLQIFEVGNQAPVSVDLAANSPGTANQAARIDHHHHLDEDIAPTWTSPHAWVTPTAEITPATGALSLTATLPATDMTGAGVPRGVSFSVTSPSGSGTPTNQSHGISAQTVLLLPNYTGSAATFAGSFINTVAGTGTSVWEIFGGGSVGVGANRGHYAKASATTNGHNVGARNDAFGGAVNAGTATSSYQPKASAVNIGLAALAYNQSNTDGKIGAFVGLYGPTTAGADFTPPNMVTMAASGGAALIVDNGDQGANTPVARFKIAGTDTVQITRLGNLYALGVNMATGTPPIQIDRNDSTTVEQIRLRNAAGTVTFMGIDSAGRLRMLESATPTHLVNNGYVYTKDFSGRTELCYFDSDGASTGAEIRITNTGALNLVAANFANPTASVGLTAVNGSATTAMRSDAAPALDQTISPTWTGLHTFLRASDARSVRLQARANQTANTLEAEYYDAGPGTSFPYFALGAGDNATNYGVVKIGYLGSGSGRALIQCTLNTTDAADANVSAFTLDIATTLSAANAMKWTNTSVGKDYMVLGPGGSFTFGYASGLTVDTTSAISMVGSTTNISTLNNAFGTALSHDNTGVTPTAINALGCYVSHSQATTVPTNGYSGVRAGCTVLIAADTTGANAVELAAVAGLPGITSYTSAFDRPNANSALRGNWKRVSVFRAGFIGTKASGPSLTSGARPLIFSCLYAPMSPYVDGTTGESWGIEIDNPASTNTPTTTPVMGGIKIAFPRYGTRQAHIYYVPNAATPASSVKGDTYFEDGANLAEGLWEHDGTAWRYILNQQAYSTTVTGTTATLGGVGSSPGTAAQAGWLKIKVDDGTANGATVYIPFWT